MRTLRHFSPAALFLSVMISCTDSRTAPARQTTPDRPSPAHAALPGAGAHAASDFLPAIVDSLRNVEGEFTLVRDSTWQFSGSVELFKRIADLEDRAVPPLVDCLDDTTPARALLRGHHVYTGVVCYEALRRFVYYEPWSEEMQGYSGSWEGFIQPTASPKDLKVAKRAWLRVLKERQYHIS